MIASFVFLIIFVFAIFLFRDYLFSLILYLKLRLEGKKPDFPLLNSLRENFIHEGKKKFAGLGQILENLEKGEKIQSHTDYFKKLLNQLKSLLDTQKENLLLTSDDIFIYAKNKRRLIKIEKRAKRFEKRDIEKIKIELKKIQDEIEKTLSKATERFSFNINEAVKEAVKTVRMEKSDVLEKKKIKIEESYPNAVKGIRLPYYVFKDWHKLLANLVRNAIEALEVKGSRVKGQGAREGDLRFEKEKNWVRVSVEQEEQKPVSITIEDSGTGMDEPTKRDFFKRGFTKKDTGLGLGITEGSVDLVNRYGSWEVESELGKGTKIKIKIEKEKAEKQRFEIEGKRTILQRVFPTPTRVVLNVLLLIILSFVILFSVDKYSRFWEDWNPDDIELRDKYTAVIKNKGNKVLWQRTFPTEIFSRCYKVSDINKDGKNEVLIAIRSGVDKTGYLYCFSHDKKLLWEFALGDTGIFGVSLYLYDPVNLLVADIDVDGELEIIIDSRNNNYFPEQIAVLNKQGKIESEYRHTGHAGVFWCGDIDKDGKLELICGGINNRLQYTAALFALNATAVYGQSPPYVDENFPKGREKIYIKFPFIKELGGTNETYSNLVQFFYNRRENQTDIYRALVVDYPGVQREYYFDQNLNFRGIYIPEGTYKTWPKLKEEGIISYDITPSVIDSWKKLEIWKEGVKIK